eukprot:693256-Prorocentrum_minimum.AAC.46
MGYAMLEDIITRYYDCFGKTDHLTVLDNDLFYVMNEHQPLISYVSDFLRRSPEILEKACLSLPRSELPLHIHRVWGMLPESKQIEVHRELV